MSDSILVGDCACPSAIDSSGSRCLVIQGMYLIDKPLTYSIPPQDVNQALVGNRLKAPLKSNVRMHRGVPVVLERARTSRTVETASKIELPVTPQN